MMSCDLYWKPTGSGKRLDTSGPSLRNAIQGEYGRTAKLTHEDIPFLRGLRAANVAGADELIDLIAKHDSIDIWTEC